MTCTWACHPLEENHDQEECYCMRFDPKKLYEPRICRGCKKKKPLSEFVEFTEFCEECELEDLRN